MGGETNIGSGKLKSDVLDEEEEEELDGASDNDDDDDEEGHIPVTAPAPAPLTAHKSPKPAESSFLKSMTSSTLVKSIAVWFRVVPIPDPDPLSLPVPVPVPVSPVRSKGLLYALALSLLNAKLKLAPLLLPMRSELALILVLA